MYLANNTRLDSCFAGCLMARFSSSFTKRHWNGVKHILRYLWGTMNIILLYSNESKSELIGYADVGYLSDPYKARSQKDYLFICRDTTISWWSMKQTLVSIFSNHAEIIVIHETSRECVWLRTMTYHIQEICDFSLKKIYQPQCVKIMLHT